MATTNTNLEEVALGQTFGQWLSAFNGNMGKIDALPLPIAYGKNTTMEYLKLSNGKVLIWGRVEYGTQYPCSNAWPSGNYVSSDFTIDLPIPLSKANPVVIQHVLSSSQNNKNPDIWFVTRQTTYTTIKGCFLCKVNDSNAVNSKALNLLLIGDWK